MKVNILVGARFNGQLVADFCQKANIDSYIYTSSPPRNWNKGSLLKKKIVFVPLIAKIFATIFRVKLGRKIRELDAIVFDFLASFVMRKPDILHGFATFSLISAKKHKNCGGYFILDRACPHVLFQERLLIEESKRLGVVYNRTSKRFVKRCIDEYSLADKIIVPSRYTLDTFLDQGVSLKKLELVRLDANFIRKRDITNIKRSGSFVVGCIGGNALRKGIIYLIEAWQKLNLRDSKLLLKTSILELKSIPVIWQKVKDDPSIEIIGYLKDIEDFYFRCDVFCLPSIDDGFGMVVFEALACGKPVIATRNVGASEVVINGETGYVVNDRDSVSLSKYISILYEDKDLLKRLSKNALEFSEAYSSNKENYFVRMAQVYKDIERQMMPG